MKKIIYRSLLVVKNGGCAAKRSNAEILNVSENASQALAFCFFNFGYDRLSFLQNVEVFDL